MNMPLPYEGLINDLEKRIAELEAAIRKHKRMTMGASLADLDLWNAVGLFDD